MQLEESYLELEHQMETPNQPLEIYRGGLKVKYKDVTLHGKGRIFVRWLPIPEIWFEMQYCEKCGFEYPATLTSKGEAIHYLSEPGPNQQENYLEITGVPEIAVKWKQHLFPSKGKFRSMNSSIKDPNIFAGNIIFPQYKGACNYIKFHIENFKNFGNLRLTEKEYTLSLDAVNFTSRTDDESNILDGRMKKTGGFIVTHIGTLERSDQSVFPITEAITYLNGFYFFASFLSGTWCGPTLARGFNDEGTVWQDGVPERLTPWTYANGCVKGWTAGIEDLFRNFMIQWSDDEKRDAINNLIQWYVESNLNAGGTEGSIILVHSALQLLANLNGYGEKSPAYCWIRKLVKDLKVSPELTSKQGTLRLIYDDNSYNLETKKKPDTWDGPSIFSELRNAIVHAKDKKNYRPPLHKVPEEAREEALDLGLWYLELCILKMLGHQGEYKNRINLKYEMVPWSSQ
jgi:hypothetical protein